MSTRVERIPLHVDVSRVVEVLAKQIYQSPFALLRENAQNAFDAILLRRALGQEFAPEVGITITPNTIAVADNGVGMTRDELESNYWRAGASGKNTAEARAAGVVGTFGIGAMANFGIAENLTVVTESARTGERTRCFAERETLSATEDCIEMAPAEPTGNPGTIVTARIANDVAVDVPQATAYVTQFVKHVTVPVTVNDTIVSQQELDERLRRPDNSWYHHGDDLSVSSPVTGNVAVAVDVTGQVWVEVSGIEQGEGRSPGTVVLRQGLTQIETMRSGFGLAKVAVSSDYQWGGIADLSALQPTAGREALETESMQLLQTLVSQIDSIVSKVLGTRPESDGNNAFLTWVARHGRWDLCPHVKIRVATGSTDHNIAMVRICEGDGTETLNYYRGSDTGIIEGVSSEESPLLIVASRRPRHQCQLGYLTEYCSVQEIADRPRVTGERKAPESWTLAESALAFRIVSILEADYFLETTVQFGEISHNLPLLVDKEVDPPEIVLSPRAGHLTNLRELYSTEYGAFGPMVKDYVRSVIFPKIQDLVPSHTKEGAEAFLRTIRKKRERFEYRAADLSSLTKLWRDFIDGRMTMADAARQASRVERRSVQIVDQASAAAVREVVPDVLENERSLRDWNLLAEEETLEALPPISRPDVPCDAKVLTIEEGEEAVRGYHLFVALADGIREERGEFFLQPHRTTVVWGGQKVLCIFEHHSGRFGFYYDLLMPEALNAEAGGGRFPTSTIVLKDRTYIPIPSQIEADFVPAPDQRKRFEVLGDLIYVEE